jgi:hypothetical protein
VLGPEEVAARRILQVLAPVQADRSGDVCLHIQRGILVDLHDPDCLLAEVLLQPVGLDEHVLRSTNTSFA